MVESVHERIARGTTRRDGRVGLEHLTLTVDQVLERAQRTYAARVGGPVAGAGAPSLAPAPAFAAPTGTASYIPPPEALVTVRRNGNGHHEAVAGTAASGPSS